MDPGAEGHRRKCVEMLLRQDTDQTPLTLVSPVSTSQPHWFCSQAIHVESELEY